LWKNVLNRKKANIIFMATCLSILLSISILHAGATASPVIAVVPQTITVGDSLPTEPFTVNVTITNVTNMFCWQVKISYDTTILNCTKAELPTDNVFAGKLFYPAPAVIEQNYVMIAATLFYEEDMFSGNGTLCQITFIGKAVGTSLLEFNVEETYYTGYDTDIILNATRENGNITVVPEFPPSLIIPLFILVTLAATVLVKTAWFKRRLNARVVKR